ncbi:S-formylglutathione hydrolase FrmB [Arcanobacterium wilhelmae]|uniref:S-formylglutathione hydrolase FrmB n=1 Tax=Arcanobacterium wilhelmae TaxID=1803177 RepID=A0ABT9ND86_9ACTO|nr:alpha/beta hydrolase-fold protein [Arcanobacterium wilhelmae]MDP9801684.1 S-formylglutathione hydrolase FrmB [Arcanobacterium wilhelmae]WFN91005.1 alpha/beta hydrolase-fold protein [Arcanobacterium wilhelmae]
MDFFWNIPLTGLPAQIVIWALVATITVGAFVYTFRANRARARLALIVAGIIDGIAVFGFFVWPNPWPGEVPWNLFVAGFTAVFTIAGVALVAGARLRLLPLAVLSAILTFLVANLTYKEYTNFGSFLPPTNVVRMSYEEFTHQQRPPVNEGRTVGALVTVPFEGPTSGFPARDAVAYIPPAYFTSQERLPVVVLLAGNPGTPDHWFTAGDAATAADNYQKAHGGRSPIIISVDGTGSLMGNPGCVDGPVYKVHTYLTKDVPALIKEHFRVNTDQHTWSIGGLSYGATCSVQIATTAPGTYGAFLSFSGDKTLEVGSREATINTLFGGDTAAWEAADPAHVLAKAADTRSDVFSGQRGMFISGAEDAEAITSQEYLARLAMNAGMNVSTFTVPGGHSFDVWRAAFVKALPFAAQTIGGLK